MYQRALHVPLVHRYRINAAIRSDKHIEQEHDERFQTDRQLQLGDEVSTLGDFN